MNNLWSIISSFVSKENLTNEELVLAMDSLSYEEKEALEDYLKGIQYGGNGQWI